MFTPIYFIIGVFAIGALAVAVLGLLMDRGNSGTGGPAATSDLLEAV